MRLILLRHGETLWNREQRLQGHDNSPLSERGIQQAKAIKPLLQQLKPVNVVASDLGRTVQTAEIIGYPDVVTDKNLRELNMGEWTGQKKQEIMRCVPLDYKSWRDGIYTPKGGESWNMFCQRIGNALRYWANQGDGDLLAIVHSGVVRAACQVLIGLPTSNLLPVTQGTLTIFEFDEHQQAKLEAYNLGGFIPDINVSD